MFIGIEYDNDYQMHFRRNDVLQVPEFRIIIEDLGWNHFQYLAMFCDSSGAFCKLPPETRDSRVTRTIKDYPYHKDSPREVDGFYMHDKYFVLAEQTYRELIYEEGLAAWHNVNQSIRICNTRIEGLNKIAAIPVDVDDPASATESDEALVAAIDLSKMMDDLIARRERIEQVVFKSLRDKKGRTNKIGAAAIFEKMLS